MSVGECVGFAKREMHTQFPMRLEVAIMDEATCLLASALRSDLSL